MAAHLFNESGQMQEVDIPDIFDVLAGGEDESAVKLLLGFSAEDEAAVALMSETGGGGLSITPDGANTYLSGSQLINSGIGNSFPQQVSLREFLTSSPGPISPLHNGSSMTPLITSPSTVMTTTVTMPTRSTSSPLNTALTKTMASMSTTSSPATIALSPPPSLQPNSDSFIEDPKQTKLILVESSAEQSSTLSYLRPSVVSITSHSPSPSSKEMGTGAINTITTIQKEESDSANFKTESTTAAISVGQTAEKPVSLTAAGTPRKREPVDPSRCIYPCDCCGKAFTTKFNLKRHINMHCSPSKEAGVPLQGPPSASQPSRKHREKREAKLVASISKESVHGVVRSATSSDTQEICLSSLPGSVKKGKKGRQGKKRISFEAGLSNTNNISPQVNTKSNVHTIVAGSVPLSSISNSNSPIVIQSNVVPNTSVLQTPSKQKNISGSAVDGTNRDNQKGSIHVVQPKTITYQIGSSSDGTLQFTLAPPTQQDGLQTQPHVTGISPNLNKGGSNILPISISTESGIIKNTEVTKRITMPLQPQNLAQLTQSLTSVVTTPNIRELIEKHRPKISVTSTTGSGSATQPPIIQMSSHNHPTPSESVAVHMIQNLSPVNDFGNRGNSSQQQQAPRIVRLIHNPGAITNTSKTYLTPLATPISAPSNMMRPQPVIQAGHQQITLQPPSTQNPASIPSVPLIQLPPLTFQHQTIPTASITVGGSQAIQFPQQPIPLIQALSSTTGIVNNQIPKQILLTNSSAPGQTLNLSELLPQGNSRFITGGDGNITLQQTANDSTNTLPTGTVLAVRTAPTSSVDQVTLPSIPAPNIAKICHNLSHGDDCQIRNIAPTSISFLSGTTGTSLQQPDPSIKYILPQPTIANPHQPSVACVESSPIVFGNTPPAEIFDSDDGEEGSSIATTSYDIPTPPPTSIFHPNSWATSNEESYTATPLTCSQNDPFVGDASHVSAVKSQPSKVENIQSSEVVPSGLFPMSNNNSQILISLQNSETVDHMVGSNNSNVKGLMTNNDGKCGAVMKHGATPPQQMTPRQEFQDTNDMKDEDNTESEYDDNEDEDNDDDNESETSSNAAASLLPSNQFHGQLLAIPNGWLRKVVSTGDAVQGGTQQQKVFYYNPVGKRFSNQDEIDQYFAKLGYSVGSTLFNFEPPVLQQNLISKMARHQSLISKDLNLKNKNIASRSKSLKAGKEKLNGSKNNKNAQRRRSQEKFTKYSAERKIGTRYPPRKRQKVLEKIHPIEIKPEESDNKDTNNLSKVKSGSSSSMSDEEKNLFVAIKTDPFSSSTIFDGTDQGEILESDVDDEQEDDDHVENNIKMEGVKLESVNQSSDDMDQLNSNNCKLPSFLKKCCDTTSSPTSSTLPATPPLILSDSAPQKEVVYNNNGYSIKSSINECVSYNVERNGSTKDESVTSTCSPPPSQTAEINSAEGSFRDLEKLTTTSGFASVSSTSTFVSLGLSNGPNGPSSF